MANVKKSKKDVRKGKTYAGKKGKVDAKERDLENSTKEAYGNDISWYVNNPQLLQDACNITFANPLSAPLEYGGSYSTGAKITLEEPGVLALHILPTIGSILRDKTKYRSGDMWDSAVNMAARAEWAFIRQKNAGAKNYDAPDLMMYHLAMDNIYMFWSWMVRLYGYMRLYSFKNKYYPYGILRAMGLTDAAIEDLRGNMANLRTYINLYAAQMSSFAVPINLPYVKRHLWLFQNAFTDASSTKAQVYLYNPEGLFRLEEVTNEPMKLVFQNMPDFTEMDNNSDISALDLIKEVGDLLLSAVVKSESAVIMSGDILKAYDASGIYGFESIPDDFSLLPVYDETVLSQIHNSNIIICSTGLDENTCFIAQDPAIDAGYIYQHIEIGQGQGDTAVILDSRFESPTTTDVMYATRLTAVVNSENSYYIDCGSEIVTGYTMWLNSQDEDDHITFGTSQLYNTRYSGVLRFKSGNYGTSTADVVKYDDVIEYLRMAAAITKFDWFPLFRCALIPAPEYTSSKPQYRGLIGDIDNFAVVQAQTISKMHRVALNSEFGLPYTLTTLK